jgi:energy-coupling factor transport system permease protein
MPVLEGATTRALVLAGSMEARGYGRDATPALRRAFTTALVLAGLASIAVGTYGLMDGTAPGVLGLPVLLAGLGVAIVGFAATGRGVGSTAYRPDPWEVPEWFVAGCGLVAAAGVVIAGVAEPSALFPSPSEWPPLSVPATVAVLVAALPAAPLAPARHRRPVMSGGGSGP